MRPTLLRSFPLAALLGSALLLPACQSRTPEGVPASSPSQEPAVSATGGATTTGDATTTGATPACAVHLWDGSNFTDDNFVIEGPGRFSSLRNLPGANGKDWHHEADALKVGASATVKAWHDENFGGAMQTYEPGSEHPDLSEEPGSLEIVCS